MKGDSEAYTDEELRKTPVYQRIKDTTAIPTGFGLLKLPDESIFPLTSDAIQEMWESSSVSGL